MEIEIWKLNFDLKFEIWFKQEIKILVLFSIS